MKKILVVDDEKSIVTLLTYNLEKEGFEVVSAFDGQNALDLALHYPFDFILLDLMLPEIDGLEVTRRLRQEKITTPIMILTAKDDEFDKIIGLELGADDYLTKPFSPREVLARMKAINRRWTPDKKDKLHLVDTNSVEEMLEVGNLSVNLSKHEVLKGNETIELAPKGYELLVFFMQHPKQVLSRESLLNGVWGFEFVGETRMVDVQISYLRDKLEVNPKKPVYLKTVRGFGYRLEVVAE